MTVTAMKETSIKAPMSYVALMEVLNYVRNKNIEIQNRIPSNGPVPDELNAELDILNDILDIISESMRPTFH